MEAQCLPLLGAGLDCVLSCVVRQLGDQRGASLCSSRFV
ncbi:MAG: hypothetical protein RJB65_1641 [Actinomycetota bacterium]